MKIADIKLTPVSYPMPFNLRWGRLSQDSAGGTVIEVITDEGIVGLGKVDIVAYSDVVSAIEESLMPVLSGQNPLNVGSLWEAMYAATRKHALNGRVMGGIDVALWDILGKIAGLPIYRLLGALRDSVPVYIAPSMKQPEVLAEELQEYKSAGYPAIKLRLGLGFVGLDSDGSIAKDREIVIASRRILGDTVAIGVDTDMTYDHDTALQMAPLLADNSIAWYEEPLTVRDREAYVQEMETLQGLVNVPLSGAQGFFSHYAFADIVSRRAVDIVQPDVCTAGGITETMRIAYLADTWGIKCMPHVSCGGGYDIGVVATAHCMAAMSNGMFLCYPAYDTPLRTELLVEQPKVIEGRFPLPEGPGLGIEINQDMLEKYRRNTS